jgi:hypothetical protein
MFLIIFKRCLLPSNDFKLFLKDSRVIMSLDTHGLEELEHLAASNASRLLLKVYLEPVKQE